MKYRNIGICPECGSPLRECVLSSGKAIPLICKCKRREKKRLEKQKDSAARDYNLKLAEKAFLETVGERYKDKTLNNYVLDPDGRDEGHMKLILAMLRNFDKFLKKGTGGLVIGGYGCGKTHLEVALGRELIRKGYTVKMFEASALYTKYMSAYSWKLRYSPTDVIEDACDADLLILDDVGVNTVDSDRDNFVKFIYGLVNYRYNQKKPILISTNLSKAELPSALTPRVFDRIRAMTYTVTNLRASMRGKGKK